MKQEELLAAIRERFSDKEFTMTELLERMHGDKKPRSNTSEYRAIMHALLGLEKYGHMRSRKIGSIKHYSLPTYKRPSEAPKRDHAEEYMRARDMVIEGLRTGRIPMFGASKDDVQTLTYVQRNIGELIQRVHAPYPRVQVVRTPLYLEIRPLM